MEKQVNKVFVFDIDGTLSNLEHRLGYIRKTPKDWTTFKALIPFDTPHEDIIWLTQCFKSHGSIILCSARDETNRKETLEWLDKHNVYFDDLFMRKANDYRDDGLIKKELLEQIKTEWGNPFMWFDDRNRVVESLREEGIRVLQVQPGNF
jgi:hypothetical protein